MGALAVLVVVCFFAGVALLVVNELLAAKVEPRVEYRYLPRDLDSYLREEPPASASFAAMFADYDLVRH